MTRLAGPPIYPEHHETVLIKPIDFRPVAVVELLPVIHTMSHRLPWQDRLILGIKRLEPGIEMHSCVTFKPGYHQVACIVQRHTRIVGTDIIREIAVNPEGITLRTALERITSGANHPSRIPGPGYGKLALVVETRPNRSVGGTNISLMVCLRGI